LDNQVIQVQVFTQVDKTAFYWTQTRYMQPTKVLLQLGLDGRTIGSSAYPSFGFGGRNSVGH